MSYQHFINHALLPSRVEAFQILLQPNISVHVISTLYQSWINDETTMDQPRIHDGITVDQGCINDRSTMGSVTTNHKWIKNASIKQTVDHQTMNLLDATWTQS